MNNFNTSGTEKVTNLEIKTVAWILGIAAIVTIFIVYALPTFYNKEGGILNNTPVGAEQTQNKDTGAEKNTVVVPEVNI